MKSIYFRTLLKVAANLAGTDQPTGRGPVLESPAHEHTAEPPAAPQAEGAPNEATGRLAREEPR